jgi:hypothetical protein
MSKADKELAFLRLDRRRDIIIRLLNNDENLSRKEVADRLGTKDATLKSWMEQNGIQIRDRTQAAQAPPKPPSSAEAPAKPSTKKPAKKAPDGKNPD